MSQYHSNMDGFVNMSNHPDTRGTTSSSICIQESLKSRTNFSHQVCDRCPLFSRIECFLEWQFYWWEVSLTSSEQLHHRNLNKNTNILQITFSNIFLKQICINIFKICNWNVLIKAQLMMSHDCFRQWLVTCSRLSHYLNQWWPIYEDFAARSRYLRQW